MAIQSKRNFLNAMRIDVSMLRAIESGVNADFSTFLTKVITSGDPAVDTYIVRGFAHTATPAPKSTFTITLANSVFLNLDATRCMFAFPDDTDDVRPFIDSADGTYYFGVKVVESDALVQQFAFKDEITKIEFNKTVPTAKELVYLETYIDDEGLNADVVFLYKVIISGGNVTAVSLADATNNETQYFLTLNGDSYDSLTQWIEAVDVIVTAAADKTVGGDLSGTYPDATVIGLLDKPFNGTPANGQTVQYNSSTEEWDFVNNDAMTKISHTYYVSMEGDDTTGNGSFTSPFATVQKAHDQALTDYPISGGTYPMVAIELLPGAYAGDVDITRHNTLIRALNANSKTNKFSIVGSVTIDCEDATQKYNDVVALQGILVSGSTNDTTPAVYVTGTGIHSVLIDNCYLTTDSSNSGANAFKVDNSNASQVRIVVANCTFTVQKSGPNIVNMSTGDARFDSCEWYFGSSVSAGSAGKAIYMTGSSVVAGDRCLIDIQTLGPAIHVDSHSASVSSVLNWTNSSITTTQASADGIRVSTASMIIFVWQDVFAVSGSGSKAIDNSTGVVVFGQLSFSPTTSSDVLAGLLTPMTEKHGTVNLPSLTASLPLKLNASKDVISQAIALGGSEVSGTLPVSKGGTNTTSFSPYVAVVADSAGTALTGVAPGTSGNVLKSNGTSWTSAAPSLNYIFLRKFSGQSTSSTSWTTIDWDIASFFGISFNSTTNAFTLPNGTYFWKISGVAKVTENAINCYFTFRIDKAILTQTPIITGTSTGNIVHVHGCGILTASDGSGSETFVSDVAHSTGSPGGLDFSGTTDPTDPFEGANLMLTIWRIG